MSKLTVYLCSEFSKFSTLHISDHKQSHSHSMSVYLMLSCNMYIIDTLRFQHFNAKSRVHKQVNKQEFLQTTNTNNYSNGDSSPLTRETLYVIVNREVLIGITPAYAGNTACCWIWHCPAQDHPRLRGKHSSVCTITPCTWRIYIKDSRLTVADNRVGQFTPF